MKKILLAALLFLTALSGHAQVIDSFGARGAYTPDAFASGALGAANNAVTVNLAGRSGVGGYVTTGTLSGTVTPECTIDGTNWLATSVYNLAAGAGPTRATTVTLNTNFALEIPPGALQCRIRVSAYTSGTSTGYLRASAAQGVAAFQPTQPVSGTVTANAGSGTFIVGDGAGALNVIIDSGTTAATQSGTWTVQPGNTANTTPWLARPHDGTLGATIRDTGTSDSINVAIVDAAGNQITAFGGSGGTSHSDDAAFTIGGASSITPVGFLADETTPDSVDEGDAGLARMTLTRKPYAVISNPTGEVHATTRDTGSNDSLNVAITDASGNQITSFGGGTEYTVNAVTPADPVGATFTMERDDALSALTEIEGDWTQPRSNANGALWTAVDGTVASTQSGTWNVNNVSGTVSLPTGAATLAEQQTQTTALQLIDNTVRSEDEASADGHAGNVILARRTATPANTSGTDLDYEALQMSAGRLWTSSTIDAALPTGANTIGAVTGSGTFTVSDGAGAMNVIVDSITAGDTDIGNVDLEFAGTAAATGNGVVSAQTQRVTIASDSTGQVALAAGSATVGNVNIANHNVPNASSTISALNDATTITDIVGYGAAGFQLVGTCTSGVVTFEGSIDGSNWVAVEVWPLGSQTATTTATAAGIWTAPVGGLVAIRARVSDACDTANFTANLRATTAAPRRFQTQVNVGTFPDNEPFNVAQFGGSAVATGTGAGGVGIPRVTISNDSSLAANQSVNAAQWGGTNVVNGGTAGTVAAGGIQAEGAAPSSNNPVFIAGRARDAWPTLEAAGDLMPPALDRAGHVRIVDPKLTLATSNGTAVTASGQIIAAPSAGNHLRLFRIQATNASTTKCLLEWREGAAGSKYFPTYMLEGSVVSFDLRGGWEVATATRLDLVLSAACSIHWTVTYQTVVD